MLSCTELAFHEFIFCFQFIVAAGRTPYYSTPVIFAGNGTVIVSSSENNVYALETATGAVRWTFPLGGASNASPALSGPGVNGTVLLFAVANNQGLYCLNAATGARLWLRSMSTTSFQGSPAADMDGNVFIGDLNGYMTAVNGSTGADLWSFRAPAAAYGEVFLSTPTISGQDVYFNVS
jgi:outer membrane protein assembly factor BamB